MILADCGKFIDGAIVNPKTLNTWMINNKLLTEDFYFDWSYINKFGFIYERSLTKIDSMIEYFNNGKAVILQNTSKNTYSVMTGYSKDSTGKVVFQVNDPKYGIASYSEYVVYWAFIFSKPYDCFSNE